jgi:hypothetical protein
MCPTIRELCAHTTQLVEYIENLKAGLSTHDVTIMIEKAKQVRSSINHTYKVYGDK